MSNTYLRLVPADPIHVPSPDQARAVELGLRRLLPAAHRIEAQTFGSVQFVDCGDGLERVLCPHCGTDLLGGTWQDLMSAAHESAFNRLTCLLPCCGRTESLNEMIYQATCGFASWKIEAMNPGRVPSEAELASLTSELGCDVRVIWSHI